MGGGNLKVIPNGPWVQRLREGTGKSQEEFAKFSGTKGPMFVFSLRALQKVESGTQVLASTLRRVALSLISAYKKEGQSLPFDDWRQLLANDCWQAFAKQLNWPANTAPSAQARALAGEGETKDEAPANRQQRAGDSLPPPPGPARFQPLDTPPPVTDHVNRADEPKPRPRRVVHVLVEVSIDASLYSSEGDALFQIQLVAGEHLTGAKVVQIRYSSIVFTFELPRADARRLIRDVRDGRYRDFGIFDARRVNRPGLALPFLPRSLRYPSYIGKRTTTYTGDVARKGRNDDQAQQELSYQWNILLYQLRDHVEWLAAGQRNGP